MTSPEASRPDADKTCESGASHLVKIETPEEMTWLAGVYDLDSQYWCGANGLKEESKTWMDGTPITFEGGFGDHDYTYDDESGCYRIVPAGVITDAEPNTWHDSPCNRKYGYICEYEGKKIAEKIALPIYKLLKWAHICIYPSPSPSLKWSSIRICYIVLHVLIWIEIPPSFKLHLCYTM